MYAKEHEEKKKKKKEIREPILSKKAILKKREIHDQKSTKNILELVSYKKSTHFHVLIKVYDLHLLEVRFLT